MDSSGEQHLEVDHNIYKRRLDLLGKPIEEPQKENITIKLKTEVAVSIDTFLYKNPKGLHDSHKIKVFKINWIACYQ